uniref:BTB domain-containing protein n=1 Tax=Rhizophagus irregularis (strain DAOM 181602 / DAOM 197198 / MUCL 43194) TaxID=747089 RepID=U9SNQ2_RHIID
MSARLLRRIQIWENSDYRNFVTMRLPKLPNMGNFSSMLNNSDDYDIIIKVGKYQNIKEFKAHSNILRARSQYFKYAILKESITKEDGMIILNKPNITPNTFKMILE